MKMKSFSFTANFKMLALAISSCLFGIVLAAYNMSFFVTEMEIMLCVALQVGAVLLLYAEQCTQDALLRYFSRYRNEIVEHQLTDLQEVHRRRVLAIKLEHNSETQQLHSVINTGVAKLDRLDKEYDWMCNAYMDVQRTNFELHDRIAYLEFKLRGTGQTDLNNRQPFSAPPSQVRFSNPVLHRYASAVPSPLAQVMRVGEVGVEESAEIEEVGDIQDTGEADE